MKPALNVEQAGFRMGCVLGHEMAGTVLDKGPDVSEALQKVRDPKKLKTGRNGTLVLIIKYQGQRVAVYPWAYDM